MVPIQSQLSRFRNCFCLLDQIYAVFIRNIAQHVKRFVLQTPYNEPLDTLPKEGGSSMRN